MAQVTVAIHGRSYDIACDDGQEERLIELGRFIDERIDELVSSVGDVGDMRLLVMTSLLLADELAEARIMLAARTEPAGSSEDGQARQAAVAALETCAERLEKIADRLEGP